MVASVSRPPRHALRPGEQRPAARRGGGHRPQGPGRLRRQERRPAPGPARARRPSTTSAGSRSSAPWSRRRRPPRTSSSTTSRSSTAWSRPSAPAPTRRGARLLDEGRRRGRQARLLRGLPARRRRLRHEERAARGQRPGQPEDLDGRPRGLPDQVHPGRRGPRGPAPARQRQRVQRRGGRGPQAIRQDRRVPTPAPRPPRRPPARSAGSTWSASRWT